MAGYSESAVCEAISAVAAWLGYSELRESQFRVVKQFLRGKDVLQSSNRQRKVALLLPASESFWLTYMNAFDV